MTIDQMARDERYWPTIREMILSGQVPASRIAELRQAYPKLGEWLDMINEKGNGQ